MVWLFDDSEWFDETMEKLPDYFHNPESYGVGEDSVEADPTPLLSRYEQQTSPTLPFEGLFIEDD